MQKTVEELFLQGFGFERYYLLKGIDWGKKNIMAISLLAVLPVQLRGTIIIYDAFYRQARLWWPQNFLVSYQKKCSKFFFDLSQRKVCGCQLMLKQNMGR